MTNAMCSYCGHLNHGGTTSITVCDRLDQFARFQNYYIRTQQHFALEAHYLFNWQPPDRAVERNLHELVRIERQKHNAHMKNLKYNQKSKYYYDPTTQATPRKRGQHRTKGN